MASLKETMSYAAQRLTEAAAAQGCPVRRVPLRLLERQGVLCSALPLSLSKGEGAEQMAAQLCQYWKDPAQWFCQPIRVRNGSLFLTLSPTWQSQLLEERCALPLPPKAEVPLGRRGAEEREFLLAYVRNRCLMGAENGHILEELSGSEEVLSLLAAERGAEQRLAQAWLALPQKLRREQRIAHAVAVRLAGEAPVFTKNSP